MFQVMDVESEERIKLEDYLGYFDIMLHGSEEEKMRQSFDLLDLSRSRRVNYHDFKIVAQSFAQMWSAALGYPMPLNLKYIKSVFQQFAGVKDYFDFEDFKVQMKANPDLLLWFSKPEAAMNKKLNQSIDETNVTKQNMLEHLQLLKGRCSRHIDKIA